MTEPGLPVPFERLYRVTDIPSRGVRALPRRFEGRTRWPGATGVARVKVVVGLPWICRAVAARWPETPAEPAG